MAMADTNIDKIKNETNSSIVSIEEMNGILEDYSYELYRAISDLNITNETIDFNAGDKLKGVYENFSWLIKLMELAGAIGGGPVQGAILGTTAYFDAMLGHFDQIEDQFQSKVNEKAQAQFAKEQPIRENIVGLLKTAEDQGGTPFTNRDDLLAHQEQERQELEKTHQAQIQAITAELTAAKESYSEKISLFLADFNEKKALLAEQLKNEGDVSEESLEILEEQYGEELRLADEAFSEEVDKQNQLLQQTIENQGAEREQLSTTQLHAVETFQIIGVAFGSSQSEMRKEIDDTNTQLHQQALKLKSVLSNYRQLISEAKKEVKILEESRINKAGESDLENMPAGDKADEEYILPSSSSPPSNNQPYSQTEIDESASRWEKYLLDGDIAPFHNGGIFRSPSGEFEGLALLKNNELILTPEQQSRLLTGQAGGLTNNFNIANMHVRNESDIDRLAMRLNVLQQLRARQV